MKKGLKWFITIAVISLLGTIAYHRFQVETKSVFFFLFPFLRSAPVDQPIRFNHIHHKEVAKLNCTFCHRYVERTTGSQEFQISNSVRPAIQAMPSAKGRRPSKWWSMSNQARGFHGRGCMNSRPLSSFPTGFISKTMWTAQPVMV